jgi:hypothetical protein
VTVQDITEQLVAARMRGAWPVEAIRSLAGSETDRDLRVEWEAGEDWLRLLHTSTVLALAWTQGPLVVTTTGHVDLVDQIGALTSERPEVVVVPHMHSPVLRLDPNRLRDIWPDRGFPIEAVDSEGGMSALDLWYASA